MLVQLGHRSTSNVPVASLGVLPFLLADPVDIWVDHAHVSGQRIIAGKGLFLGTQMATDLHFSCIVNGVLMSREIVGPGEDGVARLASAGVDPVAPMRSGLGVAQCQIR